MTKKTLLITITTFITQLIISCGSPPCGDDIEKTAHFKAHYYNNELITLEQLFNKKEKWEDYFQLELVKYNSIPNSAIFIAEAYLVRSDVFRPNRANKFLQINLQKQPVKTNKKIIRNLSKMMYFISFFFTKIMNPAQAN